MPLPTPAKGEEESKFISKCMVNPVMLKEYPDESQRRAVCQTQWDNKNKKTRMKNGKLQVLQHLSAKLVFNEDQTEQILKPLDELKADNDGLLRLPRSTLIVGDGLYNNVWHPTEEAEKSYMTWDHQPFILDHVHEVLAEIGFMEAPLYNSKTKKLSAIPVVNFNTAHGKDAIGHIQNRLIAGKVPETSVGFWCTESTEKIEMLDGEEKTVAREWEGDHNSLVYRGACSPADGAGIGLNKNFIMEEKVMTENKEKVKDTKENKQPETPKTPETPETPETSKQTSREEVEKMVLETLKKETETKLRITKIQELKKAISEKKLEDAEKLTKELYPDKPLETVKIEDVERLVRDEVAKAQSHRTTPTRDTMESPEGKAGKVNKGKLALAGMNICRFIANVDNRIDIKAKRDDYADIPMEWFK